MVYGGYWKVQQNKKLHRDPSVVEMTQQRKGDIESPLLDDNVDANNTRGTVNSNVCDRPAETPFLSLAFPPLPSTPPPPVLYSEVYLQEKEACKQAGEIHHHHHHPLQQERAHSASASKSAPPVNNGTGRTAAMRAELEKLGAEALEQEECATEGSISE